jgi:hypothetical protein
MPTILGVRGVRDIKDSPNPLPVGPVQQGRDPLFPQYAVMSFNGKFKAFADSPTDPDAMVGFAYDTTGEDPDFYVCVPGHDVINLVKGIDFSSLKQGVGIPLLTTAERDASDEYFGRLILNTSVNKFQYSNSAGVWQDVTSAPSA